MIAETHGTGGSRRRLELPAALRLRRPRPRRGRHTDVFVNCGGARAMRAPGHPQGCAVMEAAMDDLADKLGIDPLEFRLKNLAPSDFHTPDLRGRGQDRGRADRLAENASRAARTATGRSSAGWAWPCTSGAAAAPQDKQVACTINPDGSVELKTRHPGHRHRRPDDPGDHRRRGARPEADRHHVEHRQLDVPARPGLGRLDHHPVDGPAVLRRRRPRPATRCSRRSPRRSNAKPEDLVAQGRPAPGQGRAEDGLEGRLPQARHDADLRDRQVRARASPASASAAASSPR